MSKNISASVRARLLNLARERGEDFNLLLNRYALERFLYRLSASSYNDQFLLKGALLFNLWFNTPHRPTHDLDLLGLCEAETEHISSMMREVCIIPCKDGLVFDPATVNVIPIREKTWYNGLRTAILGMLGTARCPIQVDIGFGDAITHGPERVAYSLLLDDMPAPRLNAYPKATVVAEKLEAMVTLGMANSRMKDYFDLMILVREGEMDGNMVAQAISETFSRRRTPLPESVPVGLSTEFAQDSVKQKQWNAYLRKNRLEACALKDVIDAIRAYLEPLLRIAREFQGRS